MAVRTIYTRVAVDGEKQYRDAITACGRELKNLQSALKLTESEFSDNANSLDALKSKNEALTKIIDKHKEKLQTLKDGYENARKAQDVYATSAGTLRAKVDEQKVALKELAGTIPTKEYEKLVEKTKALENELAKAEGGYKSAGALVTNYGTKINKAEVELNNLNRELRDNEKYLNEAKGSADKCATSIDEFGKNTNEAKNSVDTLAEALVAAGAVAAFDKLKDAIIACTDASIQFESAFAGVKKTVDGTDAQLAAISDSIKNMALEVPSSTTAIASIAEAAGQLGIKTDDIMAFTRVMIDLGESTNMSADQAATALARFANITGMKPENYSNLGSSIVDLGNNFATTEQEIVDMAMRLVGAGKTVGMSESDVLGLAAALSSVGIEAEMGGSAISKLLVNMSATGATNDKLKAILDNTGLSLRDLELLQANHSKDFKGLADSIGMTSTELGQLAKSGKNLENFGKIAGMSGERFKTAFQEDAVGALQSFIKGLGNAEGAGDSAIEMLQEMGITEVRLRDSLLRAANAGDLLTDSVALSNKAWSENNALTKEAEQRYNTTESKLKMAKNAAENLKIAIGDQLKPVLGKIAEAGTAAFAFAAKFVEDNPWVIGAITGLVGALGTLVTAVGGLMVLEKIIPLVKLFGATLGANPAIAVAAAVAGLITALVILAEDTSEAYSETKKLNEEMKASKKAYDDLKTGIKDEETNILDLVAALKKAVDAEEKTAGQKALVSRMVDELNGKLPTLGLAYDSVTGKINLTADAIKDFVLQAMRQEEVSADIDRLKVLYMEQAEASRLAAEAQDEYNAELDAFNTRVEKYRNYAFSGADNLVYSGPAQRNFDKLKSAEAELSSEIATLTEKIEGATTAAEEHAAALGDTANATDTYAETTEQATERIQGAMSDLKQSYAEAKDDAKKSVDSQIKLFGELGEAPEASIDKMIESMKKQMKFMDGYGENLKKAMELGVDKGIVESLSDGSVQSAAYLAEIVKSGETKIGELNAAFGGVEEGKEAFSDTIAEMKTNFTDTMDGLVSEAQKIGGNWILGLVDGMKSQNRVLLDEASGTAERITAAYKKKMEIRSPSKVMERLGKQTIDGLISGLDDGPVKDRLTKIAEVLKGFNFDINKITVSDIIDADGINGIAAKWAELLKSVEDGKGKAYSSLNSQLKPFSGVKGKISVDGMIKDLKSQQQFLIGYSENLKKATASGLSEGILEELSDGSERSAKILAEIVKNSEEKISELNKAFEGTDTSKTIVAGQMSRISTHFEEEFAKLGVEGEDWGAKLVDGVVVGVDSKIQELRMAVGAVSDTVRDAFKTDLSNQQLQERVAKVTSDIQSASLKFDVAPPKLSGVGVSGAAIAPMTINMQYPVLLDAKITEILDEKLRRYNLSNGFRV
ncbi:hypothetical protein FACS1894208_01210 [Clostridia bacterium]|nr:hypothetical protein FACS1894208_01210 [Clostridia bacterium]